MSSESTTKEKTFEMPMVPFFSLDLAREVGSMDSRLARVENDIQKLDSKIDVVDAKLTAKIEAVDNRVDKCLVAINRMDERINAMDARLTGRINSLSAMMAGLWVTVIAGIVLQFFFK